MRKAFIFSPTSPYKSTPTAAAGGQDEFMSLLQGGRANTLVKDGVGVSQQRFLPFGGPRTWAAEDNTPWQNRGYTGHLHNDEVGLIYMNARYYVPSLGRFASADTIVPDPTNPQAFNRFSYVRNNPLNRIDPSGHVDCSLLGNPEDINGCKTQLPPVKAPTLPDIPPAGLTDRPYGSEAFKNDGPGGVQAYNGLVALQNEGGGWWGDSIDAEEAIMLVLNHEFGSLWDADGAKEATILVNANRYNELCSEGPWSAECFNAYWAYIHPITDLAVDAADRNNARNNVRYQDPLFFDTLRVAAYDTFHGNIHGSKAPFHYGNATIDMPPFLLEDNAEGKRNAYWMYQYRNGTGVYQIFVILTSAQHTGTLR